MIKFKHRRNFLVGSSVMLSALLLSACMETGEDLQVKANEKATLENDEPHVLSKEGLTELVQSNATDFVGDYIKSFISDTASLSTLTDFLNLGDLELTEEQAASNVEAFLTELSPVLEKLKQSDEGEGKATLHKVEYVSNSSDGDTLTVLPTKIYSMDRTGGIDFDDLPLKGDYPLTLKKEQKISLLLVETPDKNQPFAQEAKERTEQLLANATSITAMYDVGDKKNEQNENLMYVFVDNMLLQEILVREGLAKITNAIEPNTTYFDRLQQAQSDAQKERVGIWSIQ